MIIKNFFPQDENLFKFLEDKKLTADLDEDIVSDVLLEFHYIYSELEILKPKSFLNDFLTQFKRNLSKLVMLKSIRDNPLKDLNDAITKRVTKSANKTNETTMQDDDYINSNTNIDIYKNETFDFDFSSTQGADANISTSINNTNLATSIIRRNDITNGIREFVNQFNILFKNFDWKSYETSNKGLIEESFKKFKALDPLLSGDETIQEFFKGSEEQEPLINKIYNLIATDLKIIDLEPIEIIFKEEGFLVNKNGYILELDDKDYSKTLKELNVKWITLEYTCHDLQIVEDAI